MYRAVYVRLGRVWCRSVSFYVELAEGWTVLQDSAVGWTAQECLGKISKPSVQALGWHYMPGVLFDSVGQ
jgi:hypothetical protein